MNTLNWLCSKAWLCAPSGEPTAPVKPSPATTLTSPQPTTRQTEPTYNEIADQFVALYEELAQTKADVVKARQETSLATADLLKAKNQITALQSKNKNQQIQLHALTERVSQMKKAAANAHKVDQTQAAEIKRLNVHMNQLVRDKAELMRQKNTATISRAEKTKLLKEKEEAAEQYHVLRKKHGEMLFELEHFKCVSKPDVDVRSLPIVPQPFALVLIDGDAYGWASNIFASKNPGALAASKIQHAVEAHLSNLPDTSPYIKVVARAFINAQGLGYRRISRTVGESKHVFMREFTEALPLFDFFDSGSGKERADVKIKDNFQLYLSNPNCQHIYLATCTDNGFARMLEPYRYNPIRKNITLVSSGWMCRDLQALEFEVITWPDVFSARHAPPEALVKEARQQDARMRDAAHNKRLGLKGDKVAWIADFVADVAEEKLDEPLSVKSLRAVSAYNANVGVRSMRCREAQAGLELVVEDEEDTDSDLGEVD